MIDSKKLCELAKLIVNYSIAVKKGEKILIRGYGFDSYPLVKEVYRECIKAGAIKCDVKFSVDELRRIFFEEASDAQLTHLTELEKKIVDSYDATIQIVTKDNKYELKEISQKKIKKSLKARKILSDIASTKRWCLFCYPNITQAIFAGKNLDEWQDFALDTCLLDWKKVEKFEMKFIELMKKIKEVRIVGKETDLKLSIAGQNWRACCGKRNLPDGEIFTAPIRSSVDGVILYNTPSHYRDQDFSWVKLWIEKGKVVKEESDNLPALKEILATDEGARYFGEFAFGLNERIVEPTKQIIFDEKMGKSLHMALGKCYKEAPNGNDSSVHWDLIFRFKEAKATIYFDGMKVFFDGKWRDKRFLFLNIGICWF